MVNKKSKKKKSSSKAKEKLTSDLELEDPAIVSSDSPPPPKPSVQCGVTPAAGAAAADAGGPSSNRTPFRCQLDALVDDHDNNNNNNDNSMNKRNRYNDDEEKENEDGGQKMHVVKRYSPVGEGFPLMAALMFNQSPTVKYTYFYITVEDGRTGVYQARDETRLGCKVRENDVFWEQEI